jgi:amidohydrolase
MNEIEQKIVKIIDDNKDVILEFANDIYNHAELGYKEFRTSEKFVQFMEKLNLPIEKDLAITGAKAYLNQDKADNISLALIGELDALRIPKHAHVNEETQAAHCCGHHAQLAGVIGAALALTDKEVADALDGQVVFFAVPAEEYGEVAFKNTLISEGKIQYGGGKCELIRIGAFDDIDLSLAHHTSPEGIALGSGSSNGFVSKVIRLKGKASHAAGAPDKGINALSAATLGLEALALNRDTFRDEDCVRVHPILTKGGDLVNVVPDEAVIETLVRGKTLEAFADASDKTDRSFKAGALALGAGYRIETMPGYLPSLPQKAPDEMVEVVKELLENQEVKLVEAQTHGGGSSDVGDVQHLQPVITFHTGGIRGGLHQVDFEIADETEAYLTTAKIFALSAYRLLRNGGKAARKVVADYQPRFKNKDEYIEFMNTFNKVEENEQYRELSAGHSEDN